MKKVVIIGASGFVGSAILSEALERGFRVTAIVRHPEKMTVRRPELERPELEVVSGDVSDRQFLAGAVSGSDAVISAYNPGWRNPDIYRETLRVYPLIIRSVKEAGVRRLLIVGGAGSLYVAPGVRVMDRGVPEAFAPGVKGLAEVYYSYLIPEKELDWVFFSPAANLVPGERTRKFRLGKDDLIRSVSGESRISVEDYAVAMIDELEKEMHHRERFTIGD